MSQDKSLILLRGLPGSGKSTLAAELAARTKGTVVVTTDTPIEGIDEPLLSPYRMGMAYGLACGDVRRAAAGGAPLIIVDHTNGTNWEMGGFARIGAKHGYGVSVREPETPWAKDPRACYEYTDAPGLRFEDLRDLAFSWEEALPVPEIMVAPSPLERQAECQALIGYAKACNDPQERDLITHALLYDYADHMVDAINSLPLPLPADVPALVAKIKARTLAKPEPVAPVTRSQATDRASDLLRQIGELEHDREKPDR